MTLLDNRRGGYFENLTDENHIIASPATDEYNCIAWAYGSDHEWMWPANEDAFWPSGVRNDDTVEAFMDLFQSIGYVECSGGELEVGYEKVVIYALNGSPTHAARQLADGSWISKCGINEDIVHSIPEAVEGRLYGQVARYLRRIRASSP